MRSAARAALCGKVNVGDISELLTEAVSRTERLLADRTEFTIVVSGGQAAPRVLESLVANLADGRLVHVIVSDERHGASAESLNAVQLGDVIAHLPHAKNGSVLLTSPCSDGAREASASQFAKRIHELPPPDLAILGVGTDGHVAGMFHDRDLVCQSSVLSTNDGPPPYTSRITLSMAFLRSIPNRWAFVFGAEKGPLVDRLHRGSKLIVNSFEPTEWYLDRATGAMTTSIGAGS